MRVIRKNQYCADHKKLIFQVILTGLLSAAIVSYILYIMNSDPENFSDDYTDAIVYRLTADKLDLKALDSYPQKIKKVYSENPYDVEIYVKNRHYWNIEKVPYKKYRYNKSISQYLEATDTIKTNTELVSKIADSFITEDADILGIVRKALAWNAENIEYDVTLARLVWVNINSTGSAENTIKSGRGACTEYARVFIAFMRHLGIPARYVVGYYQAPDPGYHAWSEVYLKGYGWIPVETQTGKVGVPDSYVRLFAGKDLPDIGVEFHEINAHYEKIN